MIALAVIAGFTQYASLIQRDSYGVPHIKAASWGQAFRAAGYAVAQDRLWQMETSRLLARGSLAAALGPAYAASDREVLQTGYTDAELDAQVSAMSPKAREAWEQYAAGINDYVAEAKSANSLPEQFAKAGFEPSRWTTTDSAASSAHSCLSPLASRRPQFPHETGVCAQRRRRLGPNRGLG